MSDKPLPSAQVELPPDDVMEDAPPAKARRGLSPTAKLMGAAGLGVLAIGGLMFMSAAETSAPSETRKPPTLDSTPGGQVQADNEVYQESVRKYNESRARQAADLGITSMPLPESILTDLETVKGVEEVAITPVEEAVPEEKPVSRVVERRILPRPQPAPVTAAPAPIATHVPAPVEMAPAAAGPNGQEQENPYAQSISSMMQGTAPVFKPIGMQVVEAAQQTEDPERGVTAGGEGRPGDTCENCADPANSTAPDYSAENLLMRPGDLLYAETLTSVNSDMKSAVMAEVVAGEHKGARLVGSFEADKASGRMVVEFESMTFADGRVYEVAAIAVDGRSAETAVRSDIERRYVARYAPLLAATFIESYASAMGNGRTTVIGTGDSTQVITEPSTERESILAGIGSAAGAIATDISEMAPKGPKIILQAGWPLAIMLTEPVLIDTPARERPVQALPAESGPATNHIMPVRVN